MFVFCHFVLVVCFLGLCVCARARARVCMCMRARVCLCARMRVCVCVRSQHHFSRSIQTVTSVFSAVFSRAVTHLDRLFSCWLYCQSGHSTPTMVRCKSPPWNTQMQMTRLLTTSQACTRSLRPITAQVSFCPKMSPLGPFVGAKRTINNYAGITTKLTRHGQ